MKTKVIIIAGIILLLCLTIPAQQINMEQYQTKGSPTLHLLIQDLKKTPDAYKPGIITLYFMSVHSAKES